MRDTDKEHPFLDRLGLDATADAKAVRRAYARELKKLDLARDPEKFQELREAYETALHWQEYNAHLDQQAQSDALVAQPMRVARAEPAPATNPVARSIREDELSLLATSQELAQAALADFDNACEALRAGRLAHDVKLWEAALRLRLMGEQLLDLSARTMFEAHIAHLIANGWKIGHYALYFAACSVFNWPNDRRRLMHIGYAGARVNAAIDQEDVLANQEGPTFGEQRRVLRCMQRGETPWPARSHPEIVLLKRMVQYFPDLFALTVDPDLVDQLLRRPGKVRAKAAPRTDVPPAPLPEPTTQFDRRKGPPWLLIAFVLIMAAALGWNYVSDGRQPSRVVRKLPGGGGRATIAVPSYAAGRALSKQELDEIGRRIEYRPGADATPGERFIEYKIRLDGNGTMIYMERLRSSDDQAYILAVGRAIRATHFAPDVGREFVIRYSGTVTASAKGGKAGRRVKQPEKRHGLEP